MPGAGSFYAKAMDLTDQLSFAVAREVEGVTEEVVLLRVRIKAALEDDDPDDVRQVLPMVRMLAQLLMTQHRLSAAVGDGLAENLAGVIESLGELLQPEAVA